MISEEMYRLGSRRSSIRELFEYGKAAAVRDGAENVFDFSLGNPSTPPPEIFTKTLAGIIENEEPCSVHGYTSAQGAVETRRAVADDLKARFGAAVSPDRIYMTCGAAASLSITFRALVSSRDDVILATAPFFPEYRVFAEGAGASFDAVPPDTENFGVNLDALEKKLTDRAAALIINSPNNPTGAIIPRKTLEGLARLLERKSAEYGHAIYIISDEPYREITYGKEVPYIPAIYRDTVICYSYSKSLSLPGERIGYIALPDGITDCDRLYYAICGAGRSLGYVCAPALMQKAVARCAGAVSDISPYRRNRDLLYSALTAFGYECVKPDGAFYLFIKAPGGDSVAFGEKAKARNLLVVPGDDFGCPGYLRISYCVPYEVVKRSLPVFGELI